MRALECFGSLRRSTLENRVRRAISLLAKLLIVGSFALVVRPVAASSQQVLRVGHFPNITHIQALVAHGMSRQGKGWFEQRLGPDFTLQWFIYNAGPSAMEAFFANSLDLTFVGPNPALNAYAKSRGEEVRILAGAANGGSALVVQSDSSLSDAASFRGKRIATPQLGNTQDVAARSWLIKGGLKITQLGGDAYVLPTANPDQLLLFKRKELDAVWTVEPWVALLEGEAGGRVLLEEPQALTTLLVARTEFLREHRETVRKFVVAYQELTAWIRDNPEEAQRIVRQEIAAETRANLSAEVLQRAWKRITLTHEISLQSLAELVSSAQAVGFLRGMPDLSRLIEKP